MFATLTLVVALVCDGVTDNTAILNNAIAQANATNEKIIELPASNKPCVFNSQPTPITDGLSLVGQGKSNTTLQFNQNNLTFIRLREQGSTIANLSLTPGPNNSGSIGIGVQCDNGPSGCGNHVIEHIWVSSIYGSTWGVPINVDGNRTVAPLGARTLFFNDVSVFNGEYWSVVLHNCISCEWFGGGAYRGAGTTDAVYVGGTSTNVRLDMTYNRGTAVVSGLRNP